MIALADQEVRFIQAVIWPVTVLVILYLFRSEIPRLVEGLGRRVSRVSFANVSLELAVATEIAPEIWRSLTRDLQETTAVPQVPDSGSSLFRLIQGGERADYVRIDLGDGDRWITSRLYIFALIPFQLLQVRALVFLETRDGVTGRFAGLASPDSVRAALGSRYSWFEAAWLTTQMSFWSVGPEAQSAFLTLINAKSKPGQLTWSDLYLALPPLVQDAYKPVSVTEPQPAESLARTWLGDPSIYREVASTAPQTAGWLRLGPSKFDSTKVREERAQWIRSGADLDKVLGGALIHANVIESGTITRSDVYRQAVLQWSSEFVAVSDNEGRFKRLLDRDSMIARLATDQAERQQT